jgi:LysM repeat protein
LRVALSALALLVLALPVTLAYARTHTVTEGETLSSIADEYGLTTDELARLNGISDADYIFAGQELRLGDGGPAVASPAGRTHAIEAGETLSSIADYYGVSLTELLQLNAIDDADYIYEGEVISLPMAHHAPAPLTRAETEQLLRSAAAEFGVRPSLILGLAWMESGWNQSMVSWTGAIGVMQLMPATAEWGLEDLAPDAVNWDTSTADNARLGTAVFAHMLVQAGWDEELALAFYYQGRKSIELYGIFDETHQYVDNVLSLAAEFE